MAKKITTFKTRTGEPPARKRGAKRPLRETVYKDSKGKIVPLSKAKHALVYRQGRLVKKISFAKVKESVSNKTKQIAATVKSSRVAVERTKRSKAPKKKVQRKAKPVARPTTKKPRSSPLPKKKVSKKKPSPPPTRKPSKPKKQLPKKKLTKKVVKIAKEKKVVIPAPSIPKRFTLEELLNIEKLDHSKRKIRRGKFHGVVGPVTVTPYVPETLGYKKVQILKKVAPKEQHRLLNLVILDYRLKEPIAVTKNTIPEAIRYIKRNFFPHVKRFFARFGAKPYLFRLLIDREDLRFGRISHGVGERRAEMASFKSLEELWDKRLLNESMFMSFSKLNYFSQSVDGVLWITGFTIEVVRSEEPYGG